MGLPRQMADGGAGQWSVGAENSMTSLEHRPPWRQPRGKWMVSLVKAHTNATLKRLHLWEIDSRFAHGLPPGWCGGGNFPVES